MEMSMDAVSTLFTLCWKQYLKIGRDSSLMFHNFILNFKLSFRKNFMKKICWIKRKKEKSYFFWKWYVFTHTHTYSFLTSINCALLLNLINNSFQFHTTFIFPKWLKKNPDLLKYVLLWIARKTTFESLKKKTNYLIEVWLTYD